MSYKISEAVLDHSRSRYGARCVLLAIAEIAHHDGVGWLQQGWGEDASDVEKRRTLAWRAGLSERQVRRATRRLQELDEIEVVEAWDGREKFHIYRVIVGPLRDQEVDDGRRLPRLAGEFWTPEELSLPPHERPSDGHVCPWSRAVDEVENESSGAQETETTTGQNLRSSEAVADGDDRTYATATTGHMRPRRPDVGVRSYRERSKDSSIETSLTKISDEILVPADAGAISRKSRIDKLIRAFAERFGGWPGDRAGWAAWSAAFSPLVDLGVTDEELVQRCDAYRRRWTHLELTPFALTKHWLLISASLQRGFFALHSWVTETAWRLPDDEAEWVLEQASLTGKQRAKLLGLLAETRDAHADPAGAVLAWVERDGWALDDDAFRDALRAELALRSLGTGEPDVRREARERRSELRAAIVSLKAVG